MSTTSPAPPDPEEAPPPARERLPEPEVPSWIGEIARTVRECVDSTPRTIRLCVVIAVAAACLAFFR
ncbi:hypothetical protein [Streptosporangium sp. NPDC051022]|uniref:hypothetical protein n=1 Tax=Streptosporangium sp. NPDC051022 TaxID=3155752 RepID=UPI0034382B6E